MRDKLVKYHHKGIYYRFKKIGVACSFVVGAAIAFAVPVSISLHFSNVANAQVEEVSEVVETSEELVSVEQ